MYKILDAPLAVHVEINTDCNQKCCHCYNFWRGNKQKLDLRLSESLATRIAGQLAANKVFHVILTGGEPLINIETLIFLMRELSNRNITFGLNSNLALLNEENVEILKAAGLRVVLTSLLSYDEATHDYLSGVKGSFQRVVRGINIARGVGIRIAVNMVVMKTNLSHVQKTGEFSHKLDAFAFSATRVMPPRSSSYQSFENFSLVKNDVHSVVEQLLALKNTHLKLDSLVPYPSCFFDNEESWSLLGRRTCSAGKTSLAIAPDGAIRACPHHEIVYGALATEDLKDIWSRMAEWRDGSLLPKACRSCEFLKLCGGGCRVASSGKNICNEDPIMIDTASRSLESREFLKHNKASPAVADNAKLRVKNACRFRKDKVLGIINTGGIKNTFVTNETLVVFEDLQAKKLVFSPKLLREIKAISMGEFQYLGFLGELVERGVLEYVT